MSNNLKYITLGQLLSSVRNDFSSMDDEGFIDESKLIKTIMLCNEKLGIPIYRMKEVIISVDNYRAELPIDFWKVVYVCAVECESFGIKNLRNPFNNTVTLEMKQEAICEASLQPDLTCSGVCPPIIIKRKGTDIINEYRLWTPLTLSKRSNMFTHTMCLNTKGKYTIDINEETIDVPFREGELYMMYFTVMQDEDGNVLVPFHPLISNWYEWCIKEKILQDMLFNSDGDVTRKLEYASKQKSLYWLDAVNFVSEPLYKELKETQLKRDRKLYDQYYKLIV